jgi:iron complex outermembrane receptor protein
VDLPFNNVSLKNVCIYIILLFPVVLSGQPTIFNDTVRINEVVISGNRNDIVPAGYHKTEIDTMLLAKFQNGSVADVISLSSPVFIKSYGGGGSATSSLRGAGANGTQVTWNGIRVDNPMLGQVDLSLLPAGLADKISIYYGGASMVQGSGATGGIISLITEAKWKKGTDLVVSPEAGSFGEYKTGISLGTGNAVFRSATRVFLQSAENNFSYIDRVSRNESFRAVRRNSETRQMGVIQEVFRKTSSGTLAGHFWYQAADRKLPSPLLSEYAGEVQKDGAFRTIINYKSEKKYYLTGAWMRSDLNYTNRLAGISSANRTNAFVFKAGLHGKIGQKAETHFVLSDELQSVQSNNYEGKENRNSADLSFSANNINRGILNWNVLIRQILHDDKLLSPDFTGGLELSPLRVKEYRLRANFSRNSRIPSMNDLYWNPGGNRNLQNEYSYIAEAGLDISHDFNLFGLKYDLTLFNNKINDMIQWRPGEFSYWVASNISSVHSSGFETSGSIVFNTGRITSKMRSGYSRTIAREITEDGSKGQLIYVPVDQFNASVDFGYGVIYSGFMISYTGLRFTTADNDQYLPAYTLTSSELGIRKDTGWGVLDSSFHVDNLFNADYQNIAYYPMPGRTFRIKILAKIVFQK